MNYQNQARKGQFQFPPSAKNKPITGLSGSYQGQSYPFQRKPSNEGFFKDKKAHAPYSDPQRQVDVPVNEPEFSKSALQNFQVSTVNHDNAPFRRTQSARQARDQQNLPTNLGARGAICRLCDVQGHSLNFCTRYRTGEQRLEQCVARKMCIHCTSVQHSSSECKGVTNCLPYACKRCASRDHISALCCNASS